MFDVSERKQFYNLQDHVAVIDYLQILLLTLCALTPEEERKLTCYFHTSLWWRKRSVKIKTYLIQLNQKKKLIQPEMHGVGRLNIN